MDTRPEQVFEHEIRVTWGDCDPAKIVYTGRIPWFALDAINAWWAEKLGEDWYRMELDRGVGTPFVNLNMDFRSPITPRHPLICAVWPLRLGTTSITFRVDGMQDGQLCFEGQFICVFTDAKDFVKRPAPDDMRAVVEAALP